MSVFGLKTRLVLLAKYIYDLYPGLIKNLGLLDLVRFPLYKKIYLKQIDKKMQQFQSGAIAVEFEVTNNCNADCVMCPNSLMKRPIGRMNMDLFRQIVDEFAKENLPLIKFVFAGIGEPTLDPELAEKIKYLKKTIPQVPVQVTTNASLLNETRSRELIEAGLDQMIISFNGTTKESYEAVMGNLKFDKSLQNVLNFLNLRKNNKPAVTISCVRLDANAEDFSGMEQFWKSKGANFDSVKTPVPFNRGGDQMQKRYTSKWALPKPSSPSHLLPCRMMGENLLIHPDGTIALCFADYEEKHVMGKLGQNSIQDILKTKQSWFERHKKGDFSHTPLCSSCTFMREQSVAWWKDTYF